MRSLAEILRSRMLRAQSRSPIQRLVFAVGALLSVSVGATLYYHFAEGMSWQEAVYMTVITLSTVGFEEIQPLSPQGRWFTVALISVGLGLALYTIVFAAEFVVEGQLMDALGRRSMEKILSQTKDHVVVCGFGRLGQVVVEELRRTDMPTVVVDLDPEVEPVLLEAGLPYILGSALETEVLEKAGVCRAKAIVISTPSDANNVFIALSARELNPHLTVHARAESKAGERHLALAKADQIISPYHLGGQRIANALVRPAVMDFIEISSPGGDTDIVLEEVVLAEGCALHGTLLRDLPKHEVRIAVVGVQRGNAQMRVMPMPDEVLQGGDRIVVVGEEEQLTRLSRLAQAG